MSWPNRAGKGRSRTVARGRPHRVVEQLRDARVARGLTLAALAKKCGYNATSLCNWETGKHTPTLRHLEDWCAGLGLELVVRPYAGHD